MGLGDNSFGDHCFVNYMNYDFACPAVMGLEAFYSSQASVKEVALGFLITFLEIKLYSKTQKQFPLFKAIMQRLSQKLLLLKVLLNK